MKHAYGESDVAQIVQDVVLPRAVPGTILTLEGQLGAGKTTLVRATLSTLGVQGAITSPTFGYVNTYVVGGQTIHHFDLYRLASADEFCEAGFEEYLTDEHAIIFIEWPAVIASVLERYASVVRLELSYDSKNLSQRFLAVFSKETSKT